MNECGNTDESVSSSGDNDISLVADGITIEANKELLSKSSAYFGAMFRSNMKESTLDTITIHSVAPFVLETLVESSRQEDIQLSIKTVYDILDGACMLQFTDVTEQCIQYLHSKLDTLSCLTTMFVAARNGIQELYYKARRFALWYFTAVQNQEAFIQLPIDGLLDYISDDMLNVKTEYEVVAAALRWLSHNEDQIVHVTEVLKVLRLGLLTEEQLELLLKNEIMQNSSECQLLINNVLRCRSNRNDCKLPEVQFMFLILFSL